MSAPRLQPVNASIADIQCAGTESAKKERLVLLLKDHFPGAEAAALIRDFVAGTELGADGGALAPPQLGRLRGELCEHPGQELQAMDAAPRRLWKMA